MPPAVPAPELIAAAQVAKPPPRIRPGHFEALIPVTRVLLDRGFTLTHAAEWLVEQRAMEPRLTPHFVRCLRPPFQRFRKVKAQAGDVYSWRRSLNLPAAHVVGLGVIALCRAQTVRWMDDDAEIPKCPSCIGIARRLGLDLPGIAREYQSRAYPEGRARAPGGFAKGAS